MNSIWKHKLLSTSVGKVVTWSPPFFGWNSEKYLRVNICLKRNSSPNRYALEYNIWWVLLHSQSAYFCISQILTVKLLPSFYGNLEVFHILSWGGIWDMELIKSNLNLHWWWREIGIEVKIHKHYHYGHLEKELNIISWLP